MKMHGVVPVLAVLAAAQLFAAEAPKPPAMPVRADGVKLWSIPDHAPLPAEDKGKPFKVIATNWEQRPTIWGWSCELPDGSGLQFGGVNQTTDDGMGHTCVKDGANWKPIVEDLRKNNPLQKQFDAVRALRNGTKDALARARSAYFDGKTADEEIKIIKASVDPALTETGAALAKKIDELKKLSGLEAYEAGQVKFALKHLEAAVPLIKPIGAQVTPEMMASLRQGQVELEIASDALDAEPPPRALSVLAYDAKTKLFVVFGGDHFDYLMNDLWVFDPAKRKWFERHTETAPEPRADHHLDFSGDGRVVMSGGYQRTKDGYVHEGPARWIYDLDKNTWTADGHSEKTVATGVRSAGYAPPGYPESCMKGPRPNAAVFEAKLKAVPANAWTKLDVSNMISRDWSTWVFDADRDLWYVYGGGHASYPGCDVARFHLSTGFWEISDPIELPLGGAGTNEQYPSGVTFNARPWCRRHVWNSQAYEPTLKKLVNAGVNDTKLDKGFYIYDPDKADWTERHPIVDGINNCQGIQVRATVHGLLGWIGESVYLMDAKTLTWKRFETKGKMPGTCVDGCGLVYDAKRDRMLLLTLGGYAKPYDGQIFSIDMKTHDVTMLNPEGMDTTSLSWRIYLREMAIDPASDLVLITQPLNRGGKVLPDQTLSYDMGKNRWVLIKIPGTTDGSVSSSIAFDAKRNIFWGGEAGYGGGVKVLRFDPSTAEIKPLKDLPIPPPPAPPAKK